MIPMQKITKPSKHHLPMKLLPLVLFSLGFYSISLVAQQPTTSQATPASAEMALADLPLNKQRLATHLVKEVIPPLEKELQSAIGAPIKYEFDWKALALARDGFQSIDPALQKINKGLMKVAEDEMGKNSMAKKIKTVRITVDDKAEGDKTLITLKGGVLTIMPYGGSWMTISDSGITTIVSELL
jgi:hypothetical protein